MNSLFPLRYRRVLWGTAILACLVSGFVVVLTKLPVRAPKSGPGAGVAQGSPFSPAAFPAKHVAQGSHFNPAAFPAKSAEPSLIQSYGKLPLSFEINKGQTDSRVKFLSRGSGYSLFLTGNEAVLSLRKPVQMANGKRQRAKGVAQGSHLNPAAFPGLLRSPAGAAHPGSADLAFRSAAFRVAQGSLFNPAASPIRRSPGFSPASFPSLFPSSAAELNTDGGADSDCGAKDLEKPQGLKGAPSRRGLGKPCATPDPESQAPAVLRMKLVGANPQAKVTGLDELPGKSNYFIGNDPKKWRTNVPNYAKVKYANMYPGVDLVYYGNQGQMEYDFVVQPGADPHSIQLAIVSDGQVGSRQKAVGSAMEAQDPAPAGQSTIDNPSAPTSGHERRPGGGHGRRRGHLPQARRLPAGLGRRLVTCHSSLVTGRRPLSPRG